MKGVFQVRNFLKTYRWGMEMKYNMGLYFSGLVFMKAISDAVAGRFSMDTLVLMEMLFTAMAFASVESFLFPRRKEQRTLGRNTVLWVLLAHLAFVGGAVRMGWFAPTPAWMAAVLLITFELSLLAMWFGFHVVMKADTKALNEGLLRYKNGQ